jgi:hypothetical protein
MKPTPRQRWLILGSLLLATLAAGFLADDEAPPERGRTAKKAARPGAATAAEERYGGREKPLTVAEAPLDFPEPAASGGEAEAVALPDPFRSRSWYVAPPPPPPPKPTAPPLPFQDLGKLNEDGETRVFLNHQGKYLIAKVGDVINGTYSVEEIGNGRMTFLYQPLKESQVLAIGQDK